MQIEEEGEDDEDEEEEGDDEEEEEANKFKPQSHLTQPYLTTMSFATAILSSHFPLYSTFSEYFGTSDPVLLHDYNLTVRGDARNVVVYHGEKYSFRSKASLDRFLEKPDFYCTPPIVHPTPIIRLAVQCEDSSTALDMAYQIQNYIVSLAKSSQESKYRHITDVDDVYCSISGYSSVKCDNNSKEDTLKSVLKRSLKNQQKASHITSNQMSSLNTLLKSFALPSHISLNSIVIFQRNQNECPSSFSQRLEEYIKLEKANISIIILVNPLETERDDTVGTDMQFILNLSEAEVFRLMHGEEKKKSGEIEDVNEEEEAEDDDEEEEGAVKKLPTELTIDDDDMMTIDERDYADSTDCMYLLDSELWVLRYVDVRGATKKPEGEEEEEEMEEDD
ncbi:hypothetical protein ADUPG1_013865, partial [Aduncisulcus paluster]